MRLRRANLRPISAIVSSFRWCLIDMVFEKQTGLTGVCGRQRNPVAILPYCEPEMETHSLAQRLLKKKQPFFIIHELEAITQPIS